MKGKERRRVIEMKERRSQSEVMGFIAWYSVGVLEREWLLIIVLKLLSQFKVSHWLALIIIVVSNLIL